MTLEQGVAHIKARMAQHGATDDDLAIIHPDDPDEHDGLGHEGPAVFDPPSALDETADGVSADPSDTPPEAWEQHPITLPDGATITVAEARKGYLRQADFTRKTTELAQERKRVAQREQAASQEVHGLIQHMASLGDLEPNWQEYAQTFPPGEVQRAQAYWRRRAASVGQLKQLSDHANARAMQAQQQNVWNTLQTGSFDPAWKDSRTLRSGLDTLTDYLVERGIPAEIVATIHLPQIVEIAEESRRYRELLKGKSRAALAVRGVSQPFKPGARSAASAQSDNIRHLDEAFRKNPSIDNAVALHQAKAARRR
jgi:hypothetical protein